MTREEDIEQAAKNYWDESKYKSDLSGFPIEAFKAGAEWAKEQYEKNRLTACDNMTDEEFEREQKFVIEFLKDNHRTPTFSDCIEITRKEMLDKACEWLSKHLGFFVTYFYEDFIEEIDRSDFIKNFRKAMKGE